MKNLGKKFLFVVLWLLRLACASGMFMMFVYSSVFALFANAEVDILLAGFRADSYETLIGACFLLFGLFALGFLFIYLLRFLVRCWFDKKGVAPVSRSGTDSEMSGCSGN